VRYVIAAETVAMAVSAIVKTARPRKVILFGSYVRGEMDRNSDLDVLVVTGEDVLDNRKESVRIRRALRGIPFPLDIIVVTESQLREYAEIPGLIYREALRTGTVVYEPAA